MEEVSQLRVSLSLNTADFSQRLKDIGAKLRGIKSEFTAVDNGTKTWRNSLDGLTAKSEMLNRQIEIQKQKVQSLKDEYEAVAAAQGEDSRAAARLLTEYNNAVGVLRRMETSLETTNRRVNEQSSEFGQLQRQVNTSVESMDRELRVLESSMQEVNTTMGHSHGAAGEMGAGLEQLRTREQQLNQSIEIQQRRLSELQNLLEATTREEGQNSRATQEMQIRYNEANQTLNRTQSEMHQVQSQINQQSSAWGRIGQAMEQSHGPLMKMGQSLQMTGMNIAMTFGAAAATVGGALKEAITTGMEFEGEMAKVGAKSGASAQELKKLGEAAQQFAPLAGGATNAATAMDDLAAKGYGVNQIIQAMPGILNAANASGEDLALTSETITSALETFHMKATDTSHVADVLAKTSNLTAAGMQDLSYTFKYAAAPASALGVSMEQLAAMTGIMSNQGIKGEQAGTSLRAAMLRLVKPPKQAADELKNLGVKVTDTHGKFRNFSDIIGDLNAKTAKMTNAEKTAAMARIFGTEAVSGMLAVISGGKPKIDNFTKALQNSDGASEKAAKKMQNNFAGSMKKLSGTLDSVKISVEQALAPSLKSIAGTLQNLAEKFNNLSPGMKKFIAVGGAISAVVLGLVAAFGVVIMSVGGTLMAFDMISKTIMAATQTATLGAGVMEMLGSAFTFITGPIGITIAVVAGLIAIFVHLYKTNEDFRNKVQEIWSSIKSAFNVALNFIINIVKSILTEVVSFGKSMLDKFKAFWNENGQDITKIVNVVFGGIWQYIKMVFGIIKGLFEMVWPILVGVVKVAWSVIKMVISTALDVILGVIQFFAKLLTGDWKGAFTTIKDVASNIIKNIVKIFKDTDLFKIGKDIVNGFVNGFKSMAGAVKGAIKWVADLIPSGLKKILDIHSPSKVTEKIGAYPSIGSTERTRTNSKKALNFINKVRGLAFA